MLVKSVKWTLVSVLAASFLVAGGAFAAAGDPTVDWWVIGAGGGSESAGGVSLGGTAGQWVAGSDAVGIHELDAGFWAGIILEYQVFLPLVLRGT